MSIFLTTITNIVGVALIPLWLKAAIATGPKVRALWRLSVSSARRLHA